MEKFKKYLPLISAILAVLSFAMLIVPVITNVYDGVFGTFDSYNGFQTVFGTRKTVDLIGTDGHVLRYSFWNLLPYLLVVVTAVFGFFNFKKLNAKTGILSAACSIVASVLFFAVIPLTNFANQGYFVNAVKIGPGAIIAGACSLLSACAILYVSILKILENKAAKKALAEATDEVTEEAVSNMVEEAAEEAADEIIEEIVE